jgi:hypothetical protein
MPASFAARNLLGRERDADAHNDDDELQGRRPVVGVMVMAAHGDPLQSQILSPISS